MRKVAAAVGGSLAVSCHTTLAPQSVPILLTGFKAECPGLIEGHHLGDQYDLLGLSVDGWGRASACPQPYFNQLGIRAVSIPEADVPGRQFQAQLRDLSQQTGELRRFSRRQSVTSDLRPCRPGPHSG